MLPSTMSVDVPVGEASEFVIRAPTSASSTAGFTMGAVKG